jgi:2-methylcitrate dehydratase
MTLSENLSQYAGEFSFTDLSSEEIHAAKRSILDTLACGIGGYGGDSSGIVRGLIAELGGPEESTVIGDGIKVPCANAAFANGAMVRYLDYNDTYIRITEKFFTGWHPNELIPAALAVAERQHSNGKELITAVALANDIVGRFVDSAKEKSLSNRGWHMATLAGFVVP